LAVFIYKDAVNYDVIWSPVDDLIDGNVGFIYNLPLPFALVMIPARRYGYQLIALDLHVGIALTSIE
jgi:hypothetical protein